MEKKIDELLVQLTKKSGANEALIASIEEQLGIRFPPDYRELIQRHNGAEGPIGRSSYLQLWPIEDIPVLNKIARVSEFAPGLILFGSNGGSTSYAFDIRAPRDIRFVQVPDIPLSMEEAEELGQSLRQFLERLFVQN